jgi:hypothetical protein
MKDQRAKIIKSIGSNNFEVTLLQLESGSYCILTTNNDIEEFSEPIRDLTNAMYVFEAKFIALQGH